MVNKGKPACPPGPQIAFTVVRARAIPAGRGENESPRKNAIAHLPHESVAVIAIWPIRVSTSPEAWRGGASTTTRSGNASKGRTRRDCVRPLKLEVRMAVITGDT
ncbi:hypothetical protein AB395_0000910 [Sinorhizobium fredii CCBAU 45436]|nr:hypothetical protein SF83666_c08760 [Sinorhizobium fredii CCBAU 83666]AWI56587.1 hypothetical protein AB395_0000910 [Sinorhizobium fredii CCBAU 45436]AWM24381.1 hypothetical protein AOX55_00001105 [Sinorhizobium fredii CCBAU 25509]